MPVVYIQEFAIVGDDRSTTNYDAVSNELDADANPPAGLIAHTAGFDEDGGVFRIFDVWETREDADRFISERLMPVVEKLLAGRDDAPPPDREGFYDLHHVVRG
jgi:hypothetical protein